MQDICGTNEVADQVFLQPGISQAFREDPEKTQFCCEQESSKHSVMTSEIADIVWQKITLTIKPIYSKPYGC